MLLREMTGRWVQGQGVSSDRDECRDRRTREPDWWTVGQATSVPSL